MQRSLRHTSLENLPYQIRHLDGISSYRSWPMQSYHWQSYFLETWQAPTLPSPLSDFKKALINQSAIEWYPFLIGHISVNWKSTQQSYYTWLGRQNTGKKWFDSLILQLLNISWDMWDHCNGIKHNTLTAAKLCAIKKLDYLIQDQYAQGTIHLLPHNQRWFKLPVQKLLDKYTANKKSQWLAPIYNACLKWTCRTENNFLYNLIPTYLMVLS